MSDLLALKSEWNDFMEHKRSQLRQLSQSLQACSMTETPAASMPTETAATTCEWATAGDQLTGDAVDGPHRVPDPQAPLCSADAAQPDVVVADSPSSPTDADPMARLNAIKLRLAKQIENH